MVETATSTNSRDRLIIHFLAEPIQNAFRLWSFADPAPCYAAMFREDAAGLSVTDKSSFELEVLRGQQTLNSPSFQPVFSEDALGEKTTDRLTYLKLDNTGLMWSPVKAMLRCRTQDEGELVSAIVQFTYYERELRRIEAAIAGSWQELDQDRPFAYRVGSSDLRQGALVGKRMVRALEQRMRLARIAPHLSAPEPDGPQARTLWKGLRRRLQVAQRLEAASDHLEVFEHVYEMASQRFGEFEAARQAHTVELIIIALLALETIVMVVAESSKLRVL